jgi:hypothetical protein
MYVVPSTRIVAERPQPVQPNVDAVDDTWKKEYDFRGNMIFDFDDTASGPIRAYTDQELEDMTGLDFFQLFMGDDVIQIIVDETNRFADQERTKAERANKTHHNKWALSH